MSCDAHRHRVPPSYSVLRVKQTVRESQTVSQQAWDVLLLLGSCMPCHLHASASCATSKWVTPKTHTKLSSQKPLHCVAVGVSHSNKLCTLYTAATQSDREHSADHHPHQSPHSSLSATPIPMQTAMQGRAVGSGVSRPGALGPSLAPGAQRRCSTDHVHTTADCCTRRPQPILLACSSHCIPSFVVSPQ